MKINYNLNREVVTSNFRPTHLFHDIFKDWVEVNNKKKNTDWTLNEAWMSLVKCIIKRKDNIFEVHWGKSAFKAGTITLYKHED